MPKPKTKAFYDLTALPNGMGMAMRTMEHAESASVGLWVKTGGRYEHQGISGISHFVEHLLFKGTRTRSCEQLKQAVEGIGGILNGFTDEEFTCYMAKVPAKNVRRAVSVLSDMALHPVFSAKDIEKERDVIIEEIRMYEDTPGQYVHELFNQLLWPNHPLGNSLSGTTETVKRITRGDLLSYWRRSYHPRNFLVACAGGMDPERVREQLRQIFARVRPGKVGRFRAAPRVRRGPQVQLHRKVTEQTHLCFGTPALPRTHPYRFAQELLHVILGANMSSRLFREVREKRGLVYEIGTHIKRYRDAGAFVVYAGCDAAKLETTLHTIVQVLARIRRESVRPAELRRAKEYYRGQLLMSLEDTMDHMMWMGEQAVTLGRVSKPQDIMEAIDRVRPEQIRRAARRLFGAERSFLAVVGPQSEHQQERLKRICAGAAA